MVALAATPDATHEDEAPETLSDAIEAWGMENIRHMSDRAYNGIPSQEALHEVERALHAIEEFLIEPIAHNLKELADDYSEKWSALLPEEDRPVSLADIGRLIAWTDTLRMELEYLRDPIADMTCLVHEDLLTIALGFNPDGVLDQPEWKKHVRRLHGLDRHDD